MERRNVSPVRCGSQGSRLSLSTRSPSPTKSSGQRLPSLSPDHRGSVCSSLTLSQLGTPPGSSSGKGVVMQTPPGIPARPPPFRPCLATPITYEARVKDEFEGSPSAVLAGKVNLTKPLHEIDSKDLLYCSEGLDPVRSAEKLKMQLSLNSPERNPPTKPPTCLPSATEKKQPRMNPSFYHHGW